MKWRMANATPDLRYLPNHRASPPLDWYQIILLSDRGTCVWPTCPRLLLKTRGRESNPWPSKSQVLRPNHSTTRPQDNQITPSLCLDTTYADNTALGAFARHAAVCHAASQSMSPASTGHSSKLCCCDHRTSFIIFLHLQQSMASSLFSLRAWQSSQTTSLQVLFGLPLGFGPSTSYSMHFFTQSSSYMADQIKRRSRGTSSSWRLDNLVTSQLLSLMP